MRHARALCAAFTAACAAEPARVSGMPAALPVDDAPPPIGLTAPAYAFPGETITLAVTGARPARVIGFAASRATSGSRSCPLGLAPTCLDLFSPTTVLGTRVADASGAAAQDLPLPGNLPDGLLNVQVATQVAGVVSKSNVATVRVIDAGADEDGDGLVNGDERLYGTDPLRADTDGGGRSDGVEITTGTDPLDPADDRPRGACWIDFEDAFLALGDGADPTAFYANGGVGFSVMSGYGLIGGDAHGDPGNWSDGTTVTTPAWGLWDFGNEINTIGWTAPVSDVSFSVARTEGGTTIDVRIDGMLAGAVTSSAVVTLAGAGSVQDVHLVGAVDRVHTQIVGGNGFAYAIDDLTYNGRCP